MNTDPRLEDRVTDLEQRLVRIERVVRDLIESLRRRAIEVPQDDAALSARAARAVSPHAKPRMAPDPIARALEGKGSAWWLSRAGIGLLLFGLAFLFKYAVDQGWLTPQIRVAFGLVLGTVLVAIGLRVWKERHWFGVIALGGASASFYITGFAAFQLFHLVTYAPAFGFMVAVTVYTMWAAWHTDDAALSVLSALGGLGTPFILYTNTGSVAGLAGYESVVLAGMAAIYFRKGWTALLGSSVVGGWLVLLSGLASLERLNPGPADAWALQVAVLIAVGSLWAVPVWRARDVARTHKHYDLAILGFATPLIAFFLSNAIWDWNGSWGATIAGATTLFWGAAWWKLRRDARGGDEVASAHAVAAAVLLAVALQRLFTSHALLLALAIEATGVHYVARATGDRLIRFAGHGLALIVGVWLTAVLTSAAPAAVAVVNGRAAAHVGALALGLVAASLLPDHREKMVYRLGVHLLFLAWLLQELGRLPSGQAWVSVAWGVYAVGLLVVGLRIDAADVRTAGLGTLALVVAKLFLVDLAKLEAIWRVLLFMGFGAAFLALSYYFPSLWKAKPTDAVDGRPSSDTKTETGR